MVIVTIYKLSIYANELEFCEQPLLVFFVIQMVCLVTHAYFYDDNENVFDTKRRIQQMLHIVYLTWFILGWVWYHAAVDNGECKVGASNLLYHMYTVLIFAFSQIFFAYLFLPFST